MRMSNNFELIGVLTYKEKPKLKKILSEKNPLWCGYELQFAVKVGSGLFYITGKGSDMYLDNTHNRIDKYKYINSEGTKIELSESDLANQDVMDTIPFYRKKFVHDNSFVYDRDFLEALESNLENFNGKKVYIRGRIELSYGKEKDVVYKRFVPQIVKLATDQESDSYCKTELQAYFNEDAIDPNIASKDKYNTKYIEEMGNKIYINGYLAQYNSDKNTKDTIPYLYYPTQFIIKTDKLDFNNPLHTKMLTFMISQCKASGKKVVSSAWVSKINRGSVEIDLTEEQKKQMLTKEELEYLSLFPEAEEDFLKKKLQMTSEKVDEIQLLMPSPSMPLKEIQEDISLDMLELYKEISFGSKKEKGVTKEEVVSGVDYSMFD